MKRTELRRHTPLRSRPREYGTDPALPKHGRSKLPPVSKQRRRDGAARLRVQRAMRAGTPWCARCGTTCAGVFGHERLARAQGGDWLQPDCLLCNLCNTWCEDNPRIAAWTGWKISSKWPHDPQLEVGQAWDLDGRLVVFAHLRDVSERAS